MTRLHAYWRAYWMLWALCLFGAVCFSGGIFTATAMALTMLKVAS